MRRALARALREPAALLLAAAVAALFLPPALTALLPPPAPADAVSRFLVLLRASHALSAALALGGLGVLAVAAWRSPQSAGARPAALAVAGLLLVGLFALSAYDAAAASRADARYADATREDLWRWDGTETFADHARAYGPADLRHLEARWLFFGWRVVDPSATEDIRVGPVHAEKGDAWTVAVMATRYEGAGFAPPVVSVEPGGACALVQVDDSLDHPRIRGWEGLWRCSPPGDGPATLVVRPAAAEPGNYTVVLSTQPTAYLAFALTLDDAMTFLGAMVALGAAVVALLAANRAPDPARAAAPAALALAATCAAWAVLARTAFPPDVFGTVLSIVRGWSSLALAVAVAGAAVAYAARAAPRDPRGSDAARLFALGSLLVLALAPVATLPALGLPMREGVAVLGATYALAAAAGALAFRLWWVRLPDPTTA